MGKIVVKGVEPCNPAQREFILGELSRLRKSEYDFKKAPLPADLQAAQRKVHAVNKRINAFRNAQDREIKRQIKDRDRKIAAVRKAVHFGSAQAALTMLEVLQALYG